MLLWGLGVMLLMPLVAAPIALLLAGKEKLSERSWAIALTRVLGGLMFGMVWIAAVGYCAYRAYLAVP